MLRQTKCHCNFFITSLSLSSPTTCSNCTEEIVSGESVFACGNFEPHIYCEKCEKWARKWSNYEYDVEETVNSKTIGKYNGKYIYYIMEKFNILE